MRVEPFAPEHLRALVLQPSQAAWADRITEADAQALAQAGHAYSLVDGDEVVACCGVLDRTGGRGEAWALLSRRSGVNMARLTRAVRRSFDVLPYRHVTAVTACDFAPAARWVKMLGFRFVGRLTAYNEDGGDADLWQKVL